MSIVFGSCECCGEGPATCLGTTGGTDIYADIIASCNAVGVPNANWNDKLLLGVFGDGASSPGITLPVASTSDLGAGIEISSSGGSATVEENGVTWSNDIEGNMDIIVVDDGTATLTVDFDSARAVHAVGFDMGADDFGTFDYLFTVLDSAGNTDTGTASGGFSNSAFSLGCSNGGYFATAKLGKSIVRATASFNGDDPGAIVMGTIVLCSSPPYVIGGGSGFYLVTEGGNPIISWG